jgi:O-acetyl-ADP-ribose deacetylase (regulator of RNase III)
MTDFLLDGDPALVLEQTSGGLIAHRETKVAYLMDDPWATLYMDTLGNSRTTMVRDGPRGLEVRRRGPFYYLTEQPIEDFPCRLLVTGIDHTGKMKGAAGQAMLARFGPQVEEAAQRALAQSDRLLGTAVLSRRPPPPIGGLHWFAHVVSTPKHTPESPGWLKKAVAGFLDHALEQKIRQVATVALGTNGGISSEEAAKLMLSSCQKWFARHPGVCMQIFFSLPAPKVRQAFEAEFRKQRVFFT